MIEGVHVVAFCAIDYEHMVSDHLQSVERWVGDNILSKTVISNAKIQTDSNLILDKDFWNIIDPNFRYANMYKHNWVKQQILKLNLHHIFDGNILLSDVEIIYKNPITWCHHDKCVQFFREKLPFETSAEYVESVIGCANKISFLTNSMIFFTDVLQDLQNHIETRFQSNQLETYSKIIFDDPCSIAPKTKIFPNEQDLYNTFLAEYHPGRIWKKQKYNDDIFHTRSHENRSWHDNSMTQWINWYEQIKDPSWPDCYRQEDFSKLPQDVQKECIETFGYRLRGTDGN